MIKFSLDFDNYLDEKRLTKSERLEKKLLYSKILEYIKEAVNNKITINHQLKKFLKENLTKEDYKVFTEEVAHLIGYSKDTILFFKR
jgi:hypothetical protein